MSYLNSYNSEKATICHKDLCVTVQGETAKMVNAIAVTAVLVIALALVGKALS